MVDGQTRDDLDESGRRHRRFFNLCCRLCAIQALSRTQRHLASHFLHTLADLVAQVLPLLGVVVLEVLEVRSIDGRHAQLAEALPTWTPLAMSGSACHARQHLARLVAKP